MATHDVELQNARLARLRQRRNFGAADRSLGFLAEQFKHEVARPFKQLEGLCEAWAQLVPADLHARCRLESLQRGVLTVAVDSSATHYRLDALIRDGLAVKLAEACRGKALRRVKVRVDTALREPAAPPEDDTGSIAPARVFPPTPPAADFDPELPR